MMRVMDRVEPGSPASCYSQLLFCGEGGRPQRNRAEEAIGQQVTSGATYEACIAISV